MQDTQNQIGEFLSSLSGFANLAAEGAGVAEKRQTGGPATEAMIVTIQLEVSDEPLLGRRCMRCTGTDFRALLINPMMQPNGRKVEYRQPGALTDAIAYYGNEQAQASLPLAMCIACKRLCALV